MNRRDFLRGSLLAGAASRLAAQQKRRNIVFILSDDHRYDFIGAMGHPWLKGKTPNMDRMVNQGIHFENAFVTTSLCSPSRASILTGLYVHKHGVANNTTALSPEVATFPKLLQNTGYRTGFIGKWHMGGDSDAPRPGFDHWFSFRGQGEYESPVMNRNGRRVKTMGYVSDILDQEALSFLRESKDQPFCLYLSHKNVHGPFEPPERYKGVFRNHEIPYPETYPNIPENNEGKPDWVLKQRNSWHGADGVQAVPGGFEAMYRGYCEALLAVDESIGRVRAELEKLGLLQDTLLVYMGDNGYQHGEHGLADKRTAYEESMRVPLMAECPWLAPAGRKVSQLVINTDIAPTFLEIAGVPVPQGLQGASCVPLMAGKPASWRNEFVYFYTWEWEAPQTPTIFALRTEQYSFIKTRGVWDRYEIYDILKDPRQKNNLLAKVYNGYRYGVMGRHIADPTLKKLYDDLNGRLAAEMKRLGLRDVPSFSATP